jgi:hypothetical protein
VLRGHAGLPSSSVSAAPAPTDQELVSRVAYDFPAVRLRGYPQCFSQGRFGYPHERAPLKPPTTSRILHRIVHAARFRYVTRRCGSLAGYLALRIVAQRCGSFPCARLRIPLGTIQEFENKPRVGEPALPRTERYSGRRSLAVRPIRVA